jgi:hypothetical protein
MKMPTIAKPPKISKLLLKQLDLRPIAQPDLGLA